MSKIAYQRWKNDGNANPCKMESRLKDALTPVKHGEVKTFTQEEIERFMLENPNVKKSARKKKRRSRKSHVKKSLRKENITS